MKPKNVVVTAFKTSDSIRFSSVREIREQVFVIEQEVEYDEEFDEFEADCMHYLLEIDGKAAGTARWRVIGEKTKLERFAVYEEYRNKGLGDVLLQAVIKDALKAGNDLYMHAQLKAIPFYERRGFQKEGELFSECNIDHYKMSLKNKK